MNDNHLIDRAYEAPNDSKMELLASEYTSNVNTLVELWSLAKMVKDVRGDSIWEVLCQMGCMPVPFENLGYSFDYKKLKGIYFPNKNGNNTIRFAIPKLAIGDEEKWNDITSRINRANSMVTESKFIIMGNEVWLIHDVLCLTTMIMWLW